jgi:hypothetical protein
MKIYKKKSISTQITVEFIQQSSTMDNPIDELREMNFMDLYMRMQLTDDEFEEWLIEMGSSFLECHLK